MEIITIDVTGTLLSTDDGLTQTQMLIPMHHFIKVHAWSVLPRLMQTIMVRFIFAIIMLVKLMGLTL